MKWMTNIAALTFPLFTGEMSIKDYEVYPDWYEGKACGSCEMRGDDCKCEEKKMNKYVLMLTGEGEAPKAVPELVPWAKKMCMITIKDGVLTDDAIEHTLRVMIQAITSEPTHGDVLRFKKGEEDEQGY